MTKVFKYVVDERARNTKGYVSYNKIKKKYLIRIRNAQPLYRDRTSAAQARESEMLRFHQMWYRADFLLKWKRKEEGTKKA